jgi:uncharacterized protein YcfJ
MNLPIRCLLLALALAAPLAAQAKPPVSLATSAAAPVNSSMLRVVCEGNDVGAEVTVDGKFKGECPIDMQVAPGTLKLRVMKIVDSSHERFFEQEIRMGDGVVKKVEAILLILRFAKVLNISPIPGPQVARPICTSVNVARKRDARDGTVAAEVSENMDTSPKTSANQQCNVVFAAGPPSGYQVNYYLDDRLETMIVRKPPDDNIRLRPVPLSDGRVNYLPFE